MTLLPSRRHFLRNFASLSLLSLTGCSALAPQETSEEWIVVVPEESQSVPEGITVLDASSETFANITALQEALRSASATQSEERASISPDESDRFVKATSDIERTSEPGVYMRYEEKIYRVYLMGLT